MDRPRILFCAHSCYLDDSNGASVASRALMESIARWGWPVEVLCGSKLDRRDGVDLEAWLGKKGLEFERRDGGISMDPRGVRADVPSHWMLDVRGVPVTVHQGPTTRPHAPEPEETEEFLRLFESTLNQFRPDILVGYGGHHFARTMFARARARGVATIFTLHNFNYHSLSAFDDINTVLVPSRFAAEHYRATLGLECVVLPNLVDFDRVRIHQREPRFLTYVNPSPEKGVFAFARIADELGHRRPDIPILVVEGRGTEATLAGCGLELRDHGNLFLMSNTHDPRAFWRRTRICLMPSLWKENQPLVAIEAMLNGIPVIGSDRGGIPETLGSSGIVLPLPERLTPATREVPSASEVRPWVEAIIALWDDEAAYSDYRLRALEEARRWAPEAVEPQYLRFFLNLNSNPAPSTVPESRVGG